MIKAERITKTFGGDKKAVDDISFEVSEGETLILLGTSGCGKTTTLRLINRLIEPSSGTVYINGRDSRDSRPEELRRGMGYVLQDSGLFPHYTVAENIAIVPALLGWDRERTRKRSCEILEKLHLPPADYMDVYPATLSGGQQQRVGLARALAADQPILLMDEPFGALDPITRAHVRKDFRSLDEVGRKTVIIVTHDVTEALELGDRICLMHEGKIAQWGTPAELLLHPVNDFVSDFFEEGRLSLELRVIRLAEVWDFFSPPAGEDPSPETTPAPEASLWDILQAINAAPEDRLKIRQQDQTRILDSAALMTAFRKYKTHQS